MPDRPIRLCSACGQADDHPRHVTLVAAGTSDAEPGDDVIITAMASGAPPAALKELIRPTVVVRHLDCCAAAGCTTCAATEQITAGARGQDLIDTIAAGVLDGFEPPEITTNKELGLDG